MPYAGGTGEGTHLKPKGPLPRGPPWLYGIVNSSPVIPELIVQRRANAD